MLCRPSSKIVNDTYAKTRTHLVVLRIGEATAVTARFEDGSGVDLRPVAAQLVAFQLGYEQANTAEDVDNHVDVGQIIIDGPIGGVSVDLATGEERELDAQEIGRILVGAVGTFVASGIVEDLVEPESEI